MNDFEFTKSWFNRVKASWDLIIPTHNAKKILEVGCFEGAATTYLINQLDEKGGGEICCVDTWEGSDEHRLSKDEAIQVERRFHRNTQKCLSNASNVISLTSRKGKSVDVLPQLIAGGYKESFDLIYIDGSHNAADVLTDAVMSFHLATSGALIIFDDYLWLGNELSENSSLSRPKIGIDAFINCFSDRLSIIPGVPLYQIFLRKL